MDPITNAFHSLLRSCGWDTADAGQPRNALAYLSGTIGGDAYDLLSGPDLDAALSAWYEGYDAGQAVGAGIDAYRALQRPVPATPAAPSGPWWTDGPSDAL